MTPWLTTTDNPWNPSTNLKDWLHFDITNKYNCNAIVDRLTHIDQTMSEEEKKKELERAIDRFIELDFRGIYKKIYV